MNEQRLEVMFTPADFGTLRERDLSGTICVVFDVLRATTSMISAIGNGALAVLPVGEISEALRARDEDPKVLLAGERDGVRIEASLTGGVAFDLGNSPREFTKEQVSRKRIVTTTTNGTRALRTCLGARLVLVSSFLNLTTTAEAVRRGVPAGVLIVGSGTYEEAAYEDVLGAGALCDLLWKEFEPAARADSALIARQIWQQEKDDLPLAISKSRNARRLLSRPELRDDVAFCAQRDVCDFSAVMGKDGWVTRG